MESRQIALIFFTIAGIIQIYEIFKIKKNLRIEKFYREIENQKTGVLSLVALKESLWKLL